MRTRTLRGAGAAVLSLGLVTTAFTSAQAAPDPTPGGFTRGPIDGLASLRSKLPALKQLSPTGRADSLRQLVQPSATPSLVGSTGITETSSACPAGQFLKTVYSKAGFEAGLPLPLESDGFTVATGAGAPEGSHWATSSLQAADPAMAHFLTSNHDAVPQTGKVFLSFAYRGDFAAGSALVAVNQDGGDLAPTSQWATVTLDITSQATTGLPVDGPGTVYVGFGQFADATAGHLDVDNVNIYTCAAPPNSGLRGDWTGQGTVDLLGTRSDGSLWVYEGKGDGTVRSGVTVGSGWSNTTWKGSPGDVNGDRRTDLLARRSDGTLWFYPGKGNGLLGAGKQVGNAWNVMTAIATPGDFDLDGRPDLVARREDGPLHLYRILATGALSYVRQIGYGWNVMTSIIGLGDVNGDKRGDITGIRTDGTMLSYLSTGRGLTGPKQVGHGFQIMNWLTSPGDLNKDGRADLVARRASDGTLWCYPGRAGGGVYSAKFVGPGWNVMASIL